MRVYICGPMRGIREFNFPAFDAARDRGRDLGWDVISPADLDRAMGFEGLGTQGVDGEWLAWLTPRGLGKGDVIKGDLDAIRTCDALAALPGWENSSGGAVEMALALFLGLDILDAANFQPLRRPTIGWL